MTTEELLRQLRQLKRTLEQLGSEFAQGHVDGPLLAEIDRMVDGGLAHDPRLAELCTILEQLRETTLTPRPELYSDGIRHCRHAKAVIEERMAELA
ncbi:MAG: hypothetical protein R2815_06270 [Flavobacteriales bacterium]